MNNLFNYFIKNRSENFLDKVLPQVYPRINTGHVCRREIQWEWIPNCWDHGGDIKSSEFPIWGAYLSLKEIKETIIKGEYKGTLIDSVTLDFKKTRGNPKRSEEEAIELMEKMDDETIVKAWFKECGKKRTRVSDKTKNMTCIPIGVRREYDKGAWRWASIIQLKG
jgi:hypothetical protein